MKIFQLPCVAWWTIWPWLWLQRCEQGFDRSAVLLSVFSGVSDFKRRICQDMVGFMILVITLWFLSEKVMIFGWFSMRWIQPMALLWRTGRIFWKIMWPSQITMATCWGSATWQLHYWWPHVADHRFWEAGPPAWWFYRSSAWVCCCFCLQSAAPK